MCSVLLVHPASKFDEIRSRHRPESDRFSEHEHGHFVCPALNVLFVIMKAHHLAQSGDISSLWPSAEPRRIWMWTARTDRLRVVRENQISAFISNITWCSASSVFNRSCSEDAWPRVEGWDPPDGKRTTVEKSCKENKKIGELLCDRRLTSLYTGGGRNLNSWT